MIRALFILSAALTACAGPSPEGLDRTRVPSAVRSDYDTFAARCSTCHSIARPLQSGITDDTFWANYVARMRAMPASGISDDDGEQILRFLRWYSAEERARRDGKETP